MPDLESHGSTRGDKIGRPHFPSPVFPPPFENKESADEGLFQICPGGHDFEKEVGKRLGIMICGEEASKTHFDR